MPLGKNRGSNLEFFVYRASSRIAHVKRTKLAWGPREDILARVWVEGLKTIEKGLEPPSQTPRVALVNTPYQGHPGH